MSLIHSLVRQSQPGEFGQVVLVVVVHSIAHGNRAAGHDQADESVADIHLFGVGSGAAGNHAAVGKTRIGRDVHPEDVAGVAGCDRNVMGSG